MNLFKKKDIIPVESTQNEVIVPVKDIKEYLVKEYENVRDLELQVEGCQQEIIKLSEVRLKYDATLVTLDEYSKRVGLRENKIKQLESNIKEKNNLIEELRDELNSYKIKFNNIATTEEEITYRIQTQTRTNVIDELMKNISDIKGNLSKTKILEIIEERR